MNHKTYYLLFLVDIHVLKYNQFLKHFKLSKKCHKFYKTFKNKQKSYSYHPRQHKIKTSKLFTNVVFVVSAREKPTMAEAKMRKCFAHSLRSSVLLR